MQKRYIRLILESKSSLEHEFKLGTRHDFRQRCKCILLSSAGWSIPELALHFGVTRNTIKAWFDRYESSGISGLRIRKGRGRKRKLDIDNTIHVDKVKSSLKKENRTVKHLLAELEEDGIKVSRSTLHSFLKNLVLDTDDIGTV